MFTTISRWAGYLLLVFIGWLAVTSAVLLLTDAAPGAIVLFPPDDFLERLPEGAAVAAAGDYWVGITSDQPALGFALYRAGAPLALPAGLPGCLPLGSPADR